MRKQFDIKYRPQIESGEYKVETRDRRPVRIVSWDFLSEKPIIGLIGMGFNNGETIATYYKQGRVATSHDDCADLFIITPGPELNEFENKLRVICEDAVRESQLFPERTSEDFAKKHSAELLALARKEPCEQIVDHIKKAYENGKAEALKDLPRWRKWENGACGNGQGIPIAIVKRGLNSYELVDALGIQGEQYIMLSDLEKLPGFNE